MKYNFKIKNISDSDKTISLFGSNMGLMDRNKYDDFHIKIIGNFRLETTLKKIYRHARLSPFVCFIKSDKDLFVEFVGKCDEWVILKDKLNLKRSIGLEYIISFGRSNLDLEILIPKNDRIEFSMEVKQKPNVSNRLTGASVKKQITKRT